MVACVHTHAHTPPTTRHINSITYMKLTRSRFYYINTRHDDTPYNAGMAFHPSCTMRGNTTQICNYSSIAWLFITWRLGWHQKHQIKCRSIAQWKQQLSAVNKKWAIYVGTHKRSTTHTLITLSNCDYTACVIFFWLFIKNSFRTVFGQVACCAEEFSMSCDITIKGARILVAGSPVFYVAAWHACPAFRA